ncbi:MAG: glycosyltransferase family 4 protein [Azoarcus sp. PHD]|nr:MAG: glycosyltransferase family 4 protein [Azoarcus sp. PHD]
MRILLLCTKFSLTENDPWLTNEFAEAFQLAGHEVTVACLDWSAEGNSPTVELRTGTGVRVIAMSPVVARSPLSFLNKGLKWTLSSVQAYRTLRKRLHNENFDLLIGFSPAVTMAAPILMLTRRLHTKSFLIQWDFFPFHHRQIGLISSPIAFHAARTAETLLLRRFDTIGCMSPANVDYLHAHYNLWPIQRVCVLPIWAKGTRLTEIDPDAIRLKYELPRTRPIVVFGGQLAPGRGLEDLLKMAELAEGADSPLCFLIMGSGPLETLVKAYIGSGHHNLRWIPRVPRSEYLEVIRACDIALVCTVRDVDVPTFPSKTLDYLRSGLPIVASVEKSTDYGTFLESNAVGISVEAGEPSKLKEAIEKLINDKNRYRLMRRNGPDCFNRNFEVTHVVRKLLEVATSTEGAE